MMKSNNKRVKVNLKGKSLLQNSVWNKGTAFTNEEREAFDLQGLLPSHVSTIEEQLLRRYANFTQCTNELFKYNFLTNLQNRNETLFFRFCLDHVNETLPYIYTPVVGEASLNFSLQYHYSRGVYIPYEKMDEIEKILRNIQKKDAAVIVATDGGRVLGLGDVGIGGMAIPIGKTSLYTLFGGIHPDKVLPVFLDVGTDNEELLNDPLYLGRKKKRVSEKKYLEFMDKFVDGVKNVFPEAMLQWEDLLGIYAHKVLERYRHKILSFNDDIQGTAAVVMAGLLSAMKNKNSSLTLENIAIFGGGAAGLGIAHSIYRFLVHSGMSEKEACDNIFIIDRNGLTYKGQHGLREEHRFFAKEKPIELDAIVSLDETIKHYKITTLIGASAQTNAFTEKTMKRLLVNSDRPIVFPLSNPDTKAEAQPQMIIEQTDGKAIVATGTAFPEVVYKEEVYPIGQCNNVYIFPAMGLFTTAFKVKTIPEEFFFIAGETLSKLSQPLLFPKFGNLREASKTIAFEIAKYSVSKGLLPKMTEVEMKSRIEETVWFPKYHEYST